MKKRMNISRLIRASFAMLFIFTISFFGTISAQSAELDYTIEIIDASSSENGDGSIAIEVFEGQPGFTYLLFDKDPKEGSKAIDFSRKISKTSYAFDSLSSGIYFVCVVDSKDNSRCQRVEVNIK
jgi:hypothetical protein